MDQVQRCLKKLNQLSDSEFDQLIKTAPKGIGGVRRNLTRHECVEAVPRWGDEQKNQLNQLCRAIGVPTDAAAADILMERQTQAAESANRLSKIAIGVSMIAAIVSLAALVRGLVT